MEPPPPSVSLKAGDGGAATAVLATEGRRGFPQEEAGIASQPDGAAAVADGDGEATEPQKRDGGNPPPPPPSKAAPAPRLEAPSAEGESPSRVEATTPTSDGCGGGRASLGSGAPSPADGSEEESESESRSLEDSLGSFSNLPSCGPSSSDLNSDSEGGAGKAPVAGGEDDDDDDGGSEEGTSPAAAASSSSAAAGSSQQPLPPSAKERFPGQSVYHIKWMRWKEENTPVITQNENGPCPLLAIMNVLLLAWKVRGWRADCALKPGLHDPEALWHLRGKVLLGMGGMPFLEESTVK